MVCETRTIPCLTERQHDLPSNPSKYLLQSAYNVVSIKRSNLFHKSQNTSRYSVDVVHLLEVPVLRLSAKLLKH